MPRYFIHLSYDGARYRGWQTQRDVKTVQETIEKCLSERFGNPIHIHGCGRTDAEVHATQYFAHIDLIHEAKPSDFVFVLNKMLPDDIVVHDLISVQPRSNAQRHTKHRTYIYRLHSTADPFLQKYSWHYPQLEKLDFAVMEQALHLLIGQHDFVQVCRQPLRHSSTLCTIYRAEHLHVSGHSYILIQGDRFLRSMVRILVHTLLKVGTRQLSLEGWEDLLHAKPPLRKVKLAPPQGLYLAAVAYHKLFKNVVPQYWPSALNLHTQKHTYD